MANITLRQVPDSVHREIKEAAEAVGMSVNNYVISILIQSVDERRRRALMREKREEFRRFISGLNPMEDSTEVLRRDRDRDHA